VSRHFDKYDVIMKVLEIIQQDLELDGQGVTGERLTQITNIIHRMDGNIVQQQIETEEIVMEGDKFENVNQSVIATHGSFAQGVISVKAQHGDEVADAFKTLEAAFTGQTASHLTGEQRKEALDLLNEIAQQGTKPVSSKSVLKSLGKSLWSLIESAEPLSKACAVAWPILQRLWT
jgi:hypothetical protein